MKPFLRKLHRWLGLLMALQILAWMGSGLYFSIFPIEVIRGEHLVRPAPSIEAADLTGLLSPGEAWQQAVAGLPPPHEYSNIRLVSRWDQVWYRVAGSASGESFRRLVHATDGTLATPLDAEAAERLAASMLVEPGVHSATNWVESVPVDSEIRGRPLPIWEVHFSQPESVSLYLDPWTGDLLAQRTTRWRVFDFLWMLHIMDFEARDDFNTILLQSAAALGLIVALSGVVFWAMTTRLWRRRRVSLP